MPIERIAVSAGKKIISLKRNSLDLICLTTKR
jgi:hypothetical protein